MTTVLLFHHAQGQTTGFLDFAEALHGAGHIVYAGFSLGVMPAQSLAQGRPGARGAIFYSAAIPTSEFGGARPETVPVQIHMMDADPWGEEDRPAAEALVKEARDGELFLYEDRDTCSPTRVSATTTRRPRPSSRSAPCPSCTASAKTRSGSSRRAVFQG
jgi:dienelactone hydrolase